MSDNSDKITQYFEAYYGTPVPLSKADILREPFVLMINTIQADIENHIPNAEPSAVKEGLLEALRYMNSTGHLSTPRLYLTDTRVATDAFRYAIAAANGKPLKRELITPKEQTDAVRREQEATSAMIDESNQRAEEQASERDSISAPLYKEYNRTKQMLIMNGESTHESKIGAYRALLGTWEYQGGVDYFVVGWKIPHEEEIYDEPEVIDMMNAHHALRGMGRQGPTQMRVNDKAWEGLK